MCHGNNNNNECKRVFIHILWLLLYVYKFSFLILIEILVVWPREEFPGITIEYSNKIRINSPGIINNGVARHNARRSHIIHTVSEHYRKTLWDPESLLSMFCVCLVVVLGSSFCVLFHVTCKLYPLPPLTAFQQPPKGSQFSIHYENWGNILEIFSRQSIRNLCHSSVRKFWRIVTFSDLKFNDVV